MIKNKTLLMSVILTASLVLSGCSISFNTGDNSATNGGMYVSSNRGDTWAQKVLIPTLTGKPKSIAALDVNAMAMDPSDYKTLYLGTQENGLFYTYDKGGNWQIASSLGKVTVNAVAVDPSDKCVIYAAVENKVYKSDDCSRSWSQVYYDNDQTVLVTAIAVDGYNANNVFIGLSRGEILKSTDKGLSWHSVARLEDKVVKIVISPTDTRVLFAGTKSKGLFRSRDNGYNWSDLGDRLKDFKDSVNFRDLAASKAKPGFIILANNYGLIKSEDNGDHWSKIELVTPEKEAIINSVFIGPQDESEIYYVTNTTFYRSLDGGKNWTTKKLPTTRAGWKLIVDPENTTTIYLGVKTIKK